MNVNRGLFVIGLLVALIGGGAVFAINFLFAPASDLILAAATDLPAGTVLAELPEEALVVVPVQFPDRAARDLLKGVARPEDLDSLQASGAVLIQDVYRYQPLVLGAIIAGDHPAAGRIPRLGLSDPEQMVLFIPASGNIPGGIQAGDRVDLAIAVGQVPDRLALEPETPAAAPEGLTRQSWEALDPQALVAVLSASGYAVQGPASGDPLLTPTALPTPTPTPHPSPTPLPLREPLSKTLVSAAEVLHVHRESSLAGYTPGGDAQLLEGPVTGLDVLVPRASLEYLTMAIHSGTLQIGLLSPLADPRDGPTLGASLQDLLDRYRADREALQPTPTPRVP